MSADLLAEFDSFYQAPKDTTKQSAPSSNDLSSLGGATTASKDGQYGGLSPWGTSNTSYGGDMRTDFSSQQPTNARHATTAHDDIWGSFEATEEPKPTPQRNAHPIPSNETFITATREQPKPQMLRRDTLEMFSNNMGDWGHPPTTAPRFPAARPPAQKTLARKSSSGGDILFDADELSEEEEDDFGDFETGESADPPPPAPPSQSLEGLLGATSINPKPSKRPADLIPTSPGFSAGMLPYPQAPKSPSFQERNPFADLGLATSKISAIKNESQQESPVTAWPTFEPAVPKPNPYQDSPAPSGLDDDWGDFADMPPESSEKVSAKPESGIEADAWAWDTADNVAEQATIPKAAEIPPPTNVPPPSVLLPIFTPLFDLPQNVLFKPVANQAFNLKNRILSDPATIEFLKAYLLIAAVAARVIAGRKLRWKRDTILSQAMKIGPAAAGGKGGMKLTGIDKAEVAREDREAADVVRAWKDQVGRLRSAVAVANSSMQDSSAHLVIPEISETMHVKSQPGALSAPKPCVVCGLKRDERIAKVDVQVEDSFGEWWTEHWGHRACKNFWLEHESKLRHR